MYEYLSNNRSDVMVISEKKTKAIIFNFTDNYQFTTRIDLKGSNIQIVDKMKILGTIVDSKLSWDDNCNLIIRKVNARMQLLSCLQRFGASSHLGQHMGLILQKYFRAVFCCVAQWKRLVYFSTKHLNCCTNF